MRTTLKPLTTLSAPLRKNNYLSCDDIHLLGISSWHAFPPSYARDNIRSSTTSQIFLSMTVPH